MCLANDEWIHLYPESTITHLSRTHSDHSPLLLNMGSPSNSQMKAFRVEFMWLSHQDFPNLITDSFMDCPNITVATSEFENRARNWNKLIFGNIFAKKKHLLARLSGIQKFANYPTSSFLHGLDANFLKEFNHVLTLETEFWKLKSIIFLASRRGLQL
ncbi:uncharacterized protein LOC124886718 [Capsicum annuum]|uniref:uncharacterized protein LOC124886718 n=1 Tax=Capsicum annuum TaxID=4072 RepID=UPI001FB159B4|nr:uncharacterized protein LOC124886718 [Capsicum annuum]